MNFSLLPLPQDLAYDGLLIQTERLSLNLEPHIRGLGKAAAEVFKGDAHVWEQPLGETSYGKSLGDWMKTNLNNKAIPFSLRTVRHPPSGVLCVRCDADHSVALSTGMHVAETARELTLYCDPSEEAHTRRHIHASVEVSTQHVQKEKYPDGDLAS
jgi:hypothetical protein